ncbi:MAG: MmcQ/YjbR family DNA-binding protein [Chthoniobacterales bacterium]
MNADQFRQIALSFPEACEGEHMGHPDFRVGGKIFATLGHPDARSGVVMLEPEEQKTLLREHPKVFAPAKGVWGKRGSTHVQLELANAPLVREALWSAWLKRAPKQLIAQQNEEL